MRPSLPEITAAAATVLGVTEAELRGPSRQATVSWARRVTVAAATRLGHSKAAIGRELNKDHSSIAYALDKIIASEGEYQRQAEEMVDRVIAAISVSEGSL